jgi:hypothetical protein
MNYKIILDADELTKFIEWLPELEAGECFYASLFARKKYHPSAKNDKSNVKRFIATSKEWLLIKLKQLEIPEGCYTNKDGGSVHNDALAVYICVNPRSFAKAQRLALKKLADVMADGHTEMNPAAIGFTAIHKSKSRTAYVDFDFDNVSYGERAADIDQILNRGAYSVLSTRGGFHLLVDPSKVAVDFKNTWHKGLTMFEECDVTGDNLIPVAGCTQGGFTPCLL